MALGKGSLIRLQSETRWPIAQGIGTAHDSRSQPSNGPHHRDPVRECSIANATVWTDLQDREKARLTAGHHATQPNTSSSRWPWGRARGISFRSRSGRSWRPTASTYLDELADQTASSIDTTALATTTVPRLLTHGTESPLLFSALIAGEAGAGGAS